MIKEIYIHEEEYLDFNTRRSSILSRGVVRNDTGNSILFCILYNLVTCDVFDFLLIGNEYILQKK